MQVKDRCNSDKVIVLGHRGDPSKEIENTIKSYSSALSSGADGIELDVHITSDEKLVVIHDFNTKRVFGVDRLVEECTLAELKEISEEIPTLDEVFSSLGKIYYDIEIKANICYDKKLIYKLVESLDEHMNLCDKIMVSSFNPLAMRCFSKVSKYGFPKGIIYDGPPTSVPRFLQKGQGRFIFPCDFLKPKWDIAIREKESKPSYPIVPWTVDSKENLEKLYPTKFPIVITNNPDLIVKALQEDGLR